MEEILAKARSHKQQQLPFVLFSTPDSKKIAGYFQQNDHLYTAENFQEKGFVMAPFDHHDNAILIPETHSEKIIVTKDTRYTVNPTDQVIPELLVYKVDFQLLVSKSIAKINTGELIKVVVSRKQKIALENINWLDFFLKSISLYPNAYNYCWYHPKVGLWLGATPEKLVTTQNNYFHSMSLAGTRKSEGNLDNEWEEKEKEEQKIVTDYILDNLKSVTQEYAISSPYTIKAGELLHIKTDIDGQLIEGASIKKVIDTLHPTPAVCGLPKFLAKDFIIDNEVHDREFYTGFLGELNVDKKGNTCSELYVNLRCMQLKNDIAYLYLGCGITKKSDPEKEWCETVHKSKTMKAIIYSTLEKTNS